MRISDWSSDVCSPISQLNPGRLDATPPEAADPAAYNLVCLAMQEPQYAVHAIWTLMVRVAEAQVPCLSIMNMPPLPYLKRIPGLDAAKLDGCYTNAHVRSEAHTSELQSLMRISYAVFCLKKKKKHNNKTIPRV